MASTGQAGARPAGRSLDPGWRRWLAAGLLAALLSACGSSGDDPPPSSQPPPGSIGPQGGVVFGPDGSRVDVPPGASPGDVTIAISKNASLAPPLVAGGSFTPVSNVFEITPHGTAFAEPVTVTLPVDPALATAQDGLVVLKAQPGGEWRVHSNVVRDGNLVSVKVRDFSVLLVAQSTLPTIPSAPAGPFRFTIDVTGTAPNLTVTYRFTGARPICTGGMTVTTVFRYTYQETVATFTGFWWSYSESVLLMNQAAYVVAGGIDEAAMGHSVVQPLLPRDQWNIRLDSRTDITKLWKPYVEGRVTCLSQASTPELASSASWTQVSENMPEIPKLAGLVALVKDIDPVQATVGERAQSAATAEIRDNSWRQSLAQNSKWDLSRDNGRTWTPLANADQVTPEANLLGGFRISTLLPELPISYNGALVRFSACVEASLSPNGAEGPPCAIGAPRPLTVSAVTFAPAVTQQPSSTSVIAGASATFSAAVTGTPAPALQWQRLDPQGVWTDIAGAESSSYTVPSASSTDDGAQFRLTATNSAGSAISATAVLSVVSQAVPPAIASTSGDLTVVAGSSAVFAATVNGTAPLSFQWHRNGVPLTGANAPILRLDQVGSAQEGDYTLQVSNPAGSVTSPALRLTVGPAAGAAVAPSIVTQPVGISVGAGSTAALAVAVSGTGPFTYQWRKDGTPIGGAVDAVFTIASAATTDAGDYSVVVSNGVGSATSNAARLSVTAAPGPIAPTITTQPASVVVIPGATATLAVAASGTGPLSFQWRRDGSDVVGATGPVLTLTAVTGIQAGAYSVVVSNVAGSVASATASVIVLGAPSITTQPGSQTVTEGQEAQFSVGASGDGLRFQWTRNGLAIPGASASSYTTPPTTSADNGAVYAVVVYNGAGIQFSGGAVLTVVGIGPPPPVPVSISNGIGDAFALSLAMDGSGNGVVVWSQNDGTWSSIYGIRYQAASGWGTWTAIESVDVDANNPQVAMDAGGNAIAVWDTGIDVYANRADAGGNWDGAGLLDNLVGARLAPVIAMNGAGDAMAVWQQSDGSNYNYNFKPWARRYTAAGGWEAGQAIGADAGNQRVAMDASGRAIAVWRQADNGVYRIFAARYTPGTDWSPAQAISSSSSEALVPDIAMSANGDAVVVWSQVDGAVQGVYAARFTVAGGWQAPQVLDGGTVDATNPRVAIDDSGNAIAVWRQYDGTRHRIYARRQPAAGAWGALSYLESPDGSDAWEPAIAMDGSGRALVVWMQWQVTTFGIFVNRYTPGGGWGGATLLADATNDVRSPRVVLDASGRAIAAWLQNGGTRTEVFAMAFAF